MSMESENRGKILVVDDEEPVAMLLQDWLTDEGYEVRQALHFDTVRRAMEQEPFDLVTLDIMMPEVDGLQILRWLREHYPDAGVVMATALGDLDAVLEAMRAGAINYLLKPFNMDLVTEEIGRAMERQRLIAENRSYQRELEQKVKERTRVLEQKVRELEGRDRLVQLQMSPPADVGEASAEILRIVAQVMEGSKVSLYQPDEGEEHLEIKAALGLSVPNGIEGEGKLRKLAKVPVAVEDSVVARVFREGQPETGAGDEMAAPVVYNEKVLGVLMVDGAAKAGEETALSALRRLGREAALVLRMVQLTVDLESGQVEVRELLQQEEEDGSENC